MYANYGTYIYINLHTWHEFFKPQNYKQNLVLKLVSSCLNQNHSENAIFQNAC